VINMSLTCSSTAIVCLLLTSPNVQKLPVAILELFLKSNPVSPRTASVTKPNHETLLKCPRSYDVIDRHWEMDLGTSGNSLFRWRYRMQFVCVTKSRAYMKLNFAVIRWHICFFLICIVGGGNKVHSTLRPLNDLSCQPRVIMIMEKSVEWWQGKPKYSEKTCPSVALSTTNHTCCPYANPGRRGGKPVSNRWATAWPMTYMLVRCLGVIFYSENM
jgi:hypothetical protein